jgi:hypothetical protein
MSATNSESRKQNLVLIIIYVCWIIIRIHNYVAKRSTLLRLWGSTHLWVSELRSCANSSETTEQRFREEIGRRYMIELFIFSWITSECAAPSGFRGVQRAARSATDANSSNPMTRTPAYEQQQQQQQKCVSWKTVWLGSIGATKLTLNHESDRPSESI